MDKVSLVLSALITVALVIFVAPNILAMNRGKMLRNIALWLGIFAGLGLIYKHFGPESETPLLEPPAMMRQAVPDGPPGIVLDGVKKDDVKEEEKPADDQGFMPPSE